RSHPPARVACPACAALRDRATGYLEALGECGRWPPLQAALGDGPGLPCRPHLGGVRALAAGRGVSTLDEAISPRLARLRAMLAGFIAKQDYRTREAPSQEEARAWSETLEHLAGRPGLFGSGLAGH